MRRLEVAIIGAGIGAQHLAGFRALKGRFRVAAICDLDLARAKALRARARLTDALQSVLDDPSIDIVDICLPPHLHFDAVTAALQAGKHVICEKPLVPSLREADQLAATARATGRQIFPVFQYRFGPGLAQLRALQDAGLTGKPHVATLETHWNRDRAYYAVDWRGTWKGEMGGALLGHAIHIHDLVASVMGPVAQIYAATATRVNEIEVEDCAALSLTLQSGALVTSSVTLGAADDTSRLRLVYAGLTATSGTNPYAPAQGGWTFTARAPIRQADIDSVLAAVPAGPAGYAGLFLAIAQHLAGQPSRVVTLDDARASLELVTAAYASARLGRPQSLPIGAEHPLYASWMP